MKKIVLYPRVAPDVLAIAEPLVPPGFELVVADPSDGPAGLAAKLADAEYLTGFIGKLPDEAWRAASKLKLVQLLSAGYDNFPIPVARERALPVSTNGGANAIAVAEHAVMLILAVYRHLAVLDRRVREGVWKAALRGDTKYHELGGKKVGLVGLGQIGRQVAKRLRGFDVELFYYDVRRLDPADEAALGATYLPLDGLIGTVDVVSLHLPLLPETRGLVNAEFLAKMRPESLLINTARGELVDEAALAAALREGPLGGAGLDVLAQEPPAKDNPLFALENVVITPHSAGPTWESWPRRFGNAFANIERVSRGESPLWVIPELR